MCRILNVIWAYSDGHIRRLLGLNADKEVPVTFMVLCKL